jgi:opacity protein-like surface antigen
MKRLVLLFILLLAFGASADGMPDGEVYIPIGRPVAPPPAATPSWYDGIYLAAEGGASWFYDIDADTGWNAGGALGYRLNPSWRVELNTSYREANRAAMSLVELPKGVYYKGSDSHRNGKSSMVSVRHDSDIGLIASMVNGIFDLPLPFVGETPIVPYVGVGIGLGVITSDGRSNDYQFAWNVLGGVGYNVWSNLHATVGYRYLQTINPSFIEPVLAHEAVVGARWEF